MLFLISPFSKCGRLHLFLQVCLFIVSSGGVSAQTKADGDSAPAQPPEKDTFAALFMEIMLETAMLQAVGLGPPKKITKNSVSKILENKPYFGFQH